MISTDYMIAQILISVETRCELSDNEGYALYRIGTHVSVKDLAGRKKTGYLSVYSDLSEKQIEIRERHLPVFEETTVDNRYEIKMVEDSNFPSMKGLILFQNETNLFLENEGRTLHFFRIPLTRWAAAWCEMTGKKSLTIHFRPEAEKYFRNTVGCFNAASFEYILYLFHRFMFHCSYVDVGGEAVLFSARSGGGKTTHGLLWEECGLGEMINGDRAAIEKTNGFIVHGLPIAGSSRVFTNRSLPLRAIFMIEKAPVNEVAELSPTRQFKMILEQLSVHPWNRDFVNAAADFVTDLISNVPIRLLRCRPDKGAVMAVVEALRRE